MTTDDLAGCLEAADAGHLHVHQHQIRLELAGTQQGRLARVGLPHHIHTVNIGQHAPDTGAHQIVVIHDEHVDHAIPRKCLKDSPGADKPGRTLTNGIAP
ncbi:hypothetical protein D3C78_1017900 [compost metagenome]